MNVKIRVMHQNTLNGDTHMLKPYEPSARELAGQDEVQITSGELAEMLREARAQAFDEGFTACNAEYAMQQKDPDSPILRKNPYVTSLNEATTAWGRRHGQESAQ